MRSDLNNFLKIPGAQEPGWTLYSSLNLDLHKVTAEIQLPYLQKKEEDFYLVMSVNLPKHTDVNCTPVQF